MKSDEIVIDCGVFSSWSWRLDVQVFLFLFVYRDRNGRESAPYFNVVTLRETICFVFGFTFIYLDSSY